MLPWLSGEPSAETLLDIFRSGGDVYRRMAMSMFGVPCEADVRPAQRGAAKVAVLACGYQGGVNALQQMAKKFGITVDDAQADVYKQMWRSANPWAQNFWAALERAAFNAVSYPGAPVSAGRVCYQYSNEVLSARLPSGRSLSYPQARIDIVEGKFGTQRVVTCIKGSLHPKRGEANWPRQQLYGGLLCENLSQGESASLLRWTLRRLADCRMLDAIIGHTHDEVILSVPEAEAEAAKKMLADIMTSGPEWAASLPLAVEISSGYAYGK